MKKTKQANRFKKICFAQVKHAAAFMILSGLSGCTRSTAANDFCLIYTPIFADYKIDSAETVHQIDWNNAAFEELCKK